MTRAASDQPPRRFLCGGKSWTIQRYTLPESKQTGLRFQALGSETRFLPLSRGTLPAEHELSSVTDEVLRMLFQRAARLSEPSSGQRP